MNENINLCEILKDCPKGWKFYSDVYGEVTFWEFSDLVYPIQLNTKNHGAQLLSEKGEAIIGDGKCILFPSKEQRDWSKFSAYWYKNDEKEKEKFEPNKKEKFDPNTLKEFDRVIVRNERDNMWRCSIFSHINDCFVSKYIASNSSFKYCIPYNDDTEHLAGTKKEAPEFYRYWDD